MKSLAHFGDLLFRQFCPGNSVLRIHRDGDEFPERWGRFELEFCEAVELPEGKLVEQLFAEKNWDIRDLGTTE